MISGIPPEIIILGPSSLTGCHREEGHSDIPSGSRRAEGIQKSGESGGGRGASIRGRRSHLDMEELDNSSFRLLLRSIVKYLIFMYIICIYIYICFWFLFKQLCI